MSATRLHAGLPGRVFLPKGGKTGGGPVRPGFTARTVALLAAWAFLVHPASAAFINLQAYVTYSLYESDQATVLADGSLVQIIGSYDDVIDPMQMTAAGMIAAPTGDDVLIATVPINTTDIGIPGTFFSADSWFHTEDVQYMYIRFFDSPGPLEGVLAWGESVMSNAQHYVDGVLEMNFIGGYATTNEDTFASVPEPGSGLLLLFLVGFLLGLRSLLGWGRPGAGRSSSHAHRGGTP